MKRISTFFIKRVATNKDVKFLTYDIKKRTVGGYLSEDFYEIKK